MTMAIGSQTKKSSRGGGGDGTSRSGGNKSNSNSSGIGGGGGGAGAGGGSCGTHTNGSGHCESESDTSISPSTEFSNMPTYRVPCKSRNGDGRSGVGVYKLQQYTNTTLQLHTNTSTKSSAQCFQAIYIFKII